jgi:hypothetical protein
LQFLPGLDDTVSVVAVNHENDALGVLEIVSPQRSNFVLSTHVPNSELDVLVFYRLNIETNRGNRGDNFTESTVVSKVCEIDNEALLQLVQDRGFPGSIETDHENSHFLLPQEPVEQLRDCETHVGVSDGSGGGMERPVFVDSGQQ